MRCNENNPCMGVYGKCLDVKITNKCNSKCPFCIENGGYEPAGISVQDMVKAANLLTDYKKVLILGGEPFMYKNLLEYIKGIAPYKDEIYITTNGTAFNFKELNDIAHYLTGVNISIMHYDFEKNAEIYGNHFLNLTDLLKAISIFHYSAVKVRINVNLVKGYIDNFSEAMHMINFAKTIGADAIRFAELQEAPEYFVDAKDVFPEIHSNPFCEGCEQQIPMEGIDVTVRLTCGIVNPLKEKPTREEPGRSRTKVEYPDSSISNGWISKDSGKAVSKHKRAPHEYISQGCHYGYEDRCH